MGSALFSLRRALMLAYRNVMAAKWRSLLSMSTILLGAVAVVATFTINENVDNYVERLIQKTGGPVLRLSVPPRNGVDFIEQDLELLRSIPYVKKVVPDLSTYSAVLRHEAKVFTPSTTGVTRDFLDADPVTVIKGEFISGLDLADDRLGIVLSPQTAKNLQLDNPVGKILSMSVSGSELAVRVIGIAKREGRFDLDLGNAWVSAALFRDMVGGGSLKKALLTAESDEYLALIERTVRKLLADRFGKELMIQNPMDSLKRTRKEMKALVYSGMVLGILALFAGSVGIMNVMLVSVRLRRREIGLYQALGFAPRLIMLQFLIESCLLSLLGGVSGSVFGSYTGVKISETLVKPHQGYSFAAVALGLLTTLLIGGAFGITPALRAARMDPVEALRG